MENIWRNGPRRAHSLAHPHRRTERGLSGAQTGRPFKWGEASYVAGVGGARLIGPRRVWGELELQQRRVIGRLRRAARALFVLGVSGLRAGREA